MTEGKSTGVAAAAKYFGKKPGQSLSEFATEWNELTDDDKAQLVAGINNGSLTY